MSGASNMSSSSISDINNMSDAEWQTAFDRTVEEIRLSEIDEELNRMTEEDRVFCQQQQEQDSRDETKATTTPPTPPHPKLEECPICKEETESPEANFVSLPCEGAHRAHPVCFKQWLESSRDRPTCPLCRQMMAHICGHALSAGLLVAGTAIPLQALESPCEENCEGREAAMERLYSARLRVFRRAFFDHVIYPSAEVLIPGQEHHRLFQGQSGSIDFSWIESTVARLREHMQARMRLLNTWIQDSTALTQEFRERHRRRQASNRAQTDRTRSRWAKENLWSVYVSLEERIDREEENLEYLKRKTEEIIRLMGDIVSIVERWMRVADREWGLGRRSTSDWWEREVRELRIFLPRFNRMERNTRELLIKWLDPDGKNFMHYHNKKFKNTTGGVEKFLPKQLVLKAPAGNGSAFESLHAPSDIEHGWISPPFFWAPGSSDPTWPAEDWTGAIPIAQAEGPNNIAGQEGSDHEADAQSQSGTGSSAQQQQQPGTDDADANNMVEEEGNSLIYLNLIVPGAIGALLGWLDIM